MKDFCFCFVVVKYLMSFRSLLNILSIVAQHWDLC